MSIHDQYKQPRLLTTTELLGRIRQMRIDTAVEDYRLYLQTKEVEAVRKDLEEKEKKAVKYAGYQK